MGGGGNRIPDPPAKNAFCRLLPSCEIAIFGPGRTLAGPGPACTVTFSGVSFSPAVGKGFAKVVAPAPFFLTSAPTPVGVSRAAQGFVLELHHRPVEQPVEFGIGSCRVGPGQQAK